MSDWLAGFEHVNGSGSGAWAGDNEDAPKIVLHTTEGPSLDGAIAALRAKSAWSHFVVDPKTRRKVQCVSLAEGSKSLRNKAGGVETNREKRVYQIEIVGYAAQTQNWSKADLEWLGKEVVGPLAAATGTPLVAPRPFYGADAGWTLAVEGARQRLTPAEWDTAKGVFGHQHVPENNHWDPGKLNVDYILEAARSAIAPKPRPWLPFKPGATDKSIYAVGGQQHEVLEVQLILTALAKKWKNPALNPGAVDGNYGPKGQAAVVAFKKQIIEMQKHMKQPVWPNADKNVGAKTINMLRFWNSH